MENIFDRLQFVRHDEVFASREDAYNYVLGKQIVERPSLVAEPMILLYESGDETKGPNVILAIGSVGDGTANQANKTFFIDTQKTEEEIIALDEKIEQAIKSLTLVPVESPTLDISTEKTDEGTIISGDVKIADYTIASGKVQNNIITVEEGKGLYAFVDMDYDPETFVITFNVNGVTKDFQLPPDQHVEKGWYSPADEAIFLKLADGSKVKIDVVKLIDEWTVLSGASETPITLFKEHVSAYTESHDGVYDWQDILTADVRVADHISDNILHKDRTGKYLYVKGTADNIKYKNNQTVADALDNIDTRVSTSAGNLIYKRPDGLYASAMLDYNSAENKLIYRYTDNQTQDFKEVSFTLNSVKILQDITYDPVKEVIVIRYIDAQGEYQRVEIPAKDIIEEWIVNNEAHNIELVKYRSEGQGKDILSADAKIHAGDNNILEDKDHKLYVNGISDNIKYDVTGDTTVKEVLDELSGKTIATDVKLDAEIERAKEAEKELEDTIGTGFTSDPHENVTAKFETLNEKVDAEIDRATNSETELASAIESEAERAAIKEAELESAITAEVERATEAETALEGRVDAIEEEIGDGFGPRNTVRNEINNLQDEIDAVSADSASSLKDIINEDHSIDVDRTNPTKPVISVNLSTELEDDRKNIIKLNNDGLFANVDLDYIPEANKLILHKTDGEGDKEIQLESMSSIISIEYNPTKEAIVITYMTNGHEVKTVEIPVGDLINEWRVEDGHQHAVQLEKVRVASGTSEQDVLKASVVITDDHDDNILVMDDGALYVSGAQISANTAAIQEEVNRATEAEGHLGNDIAAEQTRANTAEQILSGAIDSEVGRATNAETTLQRNIDSEALRATDAETVLTNKIGTGFSDDVHENVTAKFNGLNQKVDDEISRSTTKDGEIEAAIASEASRATAAEQTLQTNINNEKSRAEASESVLQNSIATEKTRAENAENSLQTNIVAEQTRAESAEEILTNKIGTGFTDNSHENVTAKFSELSDKLNTEISDRIEDVNAEQTRAEAEENALNAKIEQETTRAEGAESTLTNAINVETTRATNAETALQTNIDNEASRANSVETALRTSINNESTRATSAETALQTLIANESTRAINEEQRIETKLDNEISRSSTNYNDLSGAISSETSRATSKENELNTKIQNEERRASGEELGLRTALTAETVRATSAETALQAADNILTTNLTNEINRAREAEASILSQVENNELEFHDTSTIDLVRTEGNPDIVVGHVKIATANNNIIRVDESTYGIYAAVDLTYDSGRNILTFTTSDGTNKDIQLSEGSLIHNAWFDSNTEEIVFEMVKPDGTFYYVKVPVGSLFNQWDVDNPGSVAITLKKTVGTGSGSTDLLSAKVNVSQADDNILEVRDNNLFVSGSGITKALSGINATNNNLEVFRTTINGHNEGYTYPTHITNHIISAATSYDEADILLDQAFYEMMDKWFLLGFETPTTHTEVKEVGQNRHMLVDVRLSHGNKATGMTDEELSMTDMDDKYFSDTNVIRYINITETRDHQHLDPDNGYNGIYLSNYWDCGKYYDETETAEINEMINEGFEVYNTNYKTDTSPGAMDYNYMNNVRQSDIPNE